MNVQLVWATPNAEEMIVKMARVSAPKNQDNMDTAPRLLRYLLKHKHVSPFEMANMCVEIETTRAISPQILRHRSFSFQEFSQKNLQEARFTELDDLIKHHEWSKLFKKSDLEYIIDYLKVIRELGVVNMMEAGQFLGQTKEYLTKYFDLHRMQRELDDDKEELIEKIIDMSDKVRNIMISASITDLERKNQEITGRSATNRLNRLAGELLRWYIKSF